jgi:hypothetical protein
VPQPRQIYVGSLSRKERSWGRGRRRVVPRLAGSTAFVVAVAAVAALLPSLLR